MFVGVQVRKHPLNGCGLSQCDAFAFKEKHYNGINQPKSIEIHSLK